MTCQIGIYEHHDDSLENWNTLISLQNQQPPRELLRRIIPVLKDFQNSQYKRDIGSLSALLTWHLVDSAAVPKGELPRIALSRQIGSNIDYFCRVSPLVVEVYSIDEVLEWQMIAAMEIDQAPVEPVPPGPAPGHG